MTEGMVRCIKRAFGIDICRTFGSASLQATKSGTYQPRQLNSCTDKLTEGLDEGHSKLCYLPDICFCSHLLWLIATDCLGKKSWPFMDSI